jgi:acetyl esterase/lipase
MKQSRIGHGVWWSAGGVALVGALTFARRTRDFDQIADELQSTLSRFRWPTIGPALLPLFRAAARRPKKLVDGVEVESRPIEGPDGPLTVYIYRPRDVRFADTAMLYTHGGGMIIGSAPGCHDRASWFARALNMIVVSTEYRLAPQHPFPAPLDDVYAAYRWLTGANDLDIDGRKVVVGGESAGGGLAAALCQRVRDANDPMPIFQVLIYPMLDDRTVTSPPDDHSGQVVWTRGSNRFGWTSYLGHAPGTDKTAPYAVPARCDDLSDLPAAWIGVGTLDLFHEEDVRYARRLKQAGVDCELVVIPGAFHGFDILYPDTEITKAFRNSLVMAVRNALGDALGNKAAV